MANLSMELFKLDFGKKRKVFFNSIQWGRLIYFIFNF